MEISSHKTTIISDKTILRSITNHKYDGALLFLKENPDVYSIVAYTHNNKFFKTPEYKWVLYKIGKDIWEEVIVDDVVRLRHPFRINYL